MGYRSWRKTRVMETEKMSPILKLWILRILIKLGGHKKFIREHGFDDDSLAQRIGAFNWDEDSDRKKAMQAARENLKNLHSDMEKKAGNLTVDRCLKNNVERLSELIELSVSEARILEFAVLLNYEQVLDDVTEYLGPVTSAKLLFALSGILDIEIAAVKQAMSGNSVLIKSGLLAIDRHGSSVISRKLDLICKSFADIISTSESDPVNLLKEMVVPGRSAKLKITDYQHIQKHLDILIPYLKSSLKNERPGVNIYVYGVPGTGKTELTRTIAKELNLDLVEIATEDDDGDPMCGRDRLRAYRAAQSFFRKKPLLLAFDEVEDVFREDAYMNNGGGRFASRKGWLNRALEGNPVPTIWISNSVTGLDPAYVRRFDMIFELPVQPKKQRVRLLSSTCSNLLSDEHVNRIAECENLAPAVMTRAASVVCSIETELGASKAGAALELLINNTLEAQNYKKIRVKSRTPFIDVYDTCFLNSSVDAVEVAHGLQHTRSGRICLYGPPGSGKTAYAKWLAEELKMSLLVKCVSDLVSMYVGGTEKNLAAAFRQAQQDDAVLLIDEVDSFLQDRRGAKNSWEVTAVNEMLTQMEAYNGIFLASTNLPRNIDQAALRRFDLKIGFDYLQPDQAWSLLQKYADAFGWKKKHWGSTAEIAALKQKLSRLYNLTPGDYAVIARQQRLKPLVSVTAMVAALQFESEMKEGAGCKMGFI